MNKIEYIIQKAVQVFELYIKIVMFIVIVVFAIVFYEVLTPSVKPKLNEMPAETRELNTKIYNNDWFAIIHSDTLPLNQLEALLDAGVDINSQDEKGRTALIYATKMKSGDLIRFLIHKHADTEITDKMGVRAIDYLDRRRDKRLYEIFLNKETIEKSKEEGYTHVTIARQYDKNNNLIKTEVSGEKVSSWSPLMIAIKDFENDIVKAYIERNQYIDDKTNNGSSALFFAIKFKNNEALNLLLEHDMNLEAINKFKVKPLAFAIIQNNLYAVKALVEKGANTQAICNGVRTPLELAKVQQRGDIVRYLESVGAR